MSVAQRVWSVGLLMVAAQLAFRAWAVYPSWFFADDYRLLHDASRSRLTLGYLLEPFDSQFMPVGRLLVWLVERAGPLSWTATATTSLVLQLLAGMACLWMLTELFGPRWGVLAPLGLYLSSAMTMPPFMWWASGLNQLPLQMALFASVAGWVRYLRHRRPWDLVLVIAAVLFGLLAYVKSLILVPVLVFLALGYFTTGPVRNRVVSSVRQYWPAVVAGGLVVGTFVGYYTSQVPQLTAPPRQGSAAALADRMLASALPAGVTGGPWRWATDNSPAALANPPQVALHVTWVVLTLVVAYIALTRRRSLRAWALFTLVALADFLLLYLTRFGSLGPSIGLDYRYLADTSCVLALSLGLATMPLLGAAESSETRSTPLLRLRMSPRLMAAGTVLVVLSGLVSAFRYAHLWHTEHPGADYVRNAQADLGTTVEFDMADQVVPGSVMPPFLYPDNESERLLSLMSPLVAFPDASAKLHALTRAGNLRPADLDVAVRSRRGPDPECGWRLVSPGGRVELEETAFDYVWWLRIEYLGSADSAVRVSAGDSSISTEIRAGLNTLWVRVEGSLDAVQLDGLEPGVTLCVDQIEVGEAYAEGEVP